MSMYVTKRDGSKETVKFDKITARIQKLCYALDPLHVDPVAVSRPLVVNLVHQALDEIDAEAADAARFHVGIEVRHRRGHDIEGVAAILVEHVDVVAAKR